MSEITESLRNELQIFAGTLCETYKDVTPVPMIGHTHMVQLQWFNTEEGAPLTQEDLNTAIQITNIAFSEDKYFEPVSIDRTLASDTHPTLYTTTAKNISQEFAVGNALRYLASRPTN